jgi:hypothetical protein
MPQIGSLCRVHCKRSCPFASHCQHKVDAAEAEWFPATVKRITWNKSHDKAEVLVRIFDQTSLTVDYKHVISPNTLHDENCRELEVLIPVSESSTAFRTIWSPQVCYNRDPTGIQPGDWVQAFFQRGGTSKGWYSGRVARVHRPRAREPMCDILYDDGDYETDIPVSSEYVHILKRGRDFPEWLMGLPFEQRKSRNSKHETALTQALTPRGLVEIFFTDHDTNKTRLQTRPYSDVVASLMQAAIERVPAKQKYSWLKARIPATPVSETPKMDDTLPSRRQMRSTISKLGGEKLGGEDVGEPVLTIH